MSFAFHSILACFLLLGSVKTLYLSPCGQARPGQHWRLHDDGTVRPAADDSRCLTAVVLRGHYGASVQDKNLVVAADCRNDSTAFVQEWKYSNTTSLLALANDTTFVLQADSFTTGAQVSLRKCDDSKCVSLSRWNYTSNETFETHDIFCLDGTSTSSRSCDENSPSRSLPFCNASLPLAERVADLAERVADLAGRVSLDDQIVQLSAIYAAPILDLGIPSFWWDQTCIHGVADDYDMSHYSMQTRLASYVTIFPHAIAQAASFDVTLARRITKATADEARALNARRYALGYLDASNVCLIGIGGPLANLVHDPRWGRTSETKTRTSSRFASQVRRDTFTLDWAHWTFLE